MMAGDVLLITSKIQIMDRGLVADFESDICSRVVLSWPRIDGSVHGGEAGMMAGDVLLLTSTIQIVDRELVAGFESDICSRIVLSWPGIGDSLHGGEASMVAGDVVLGCFCPDDWPVCVCAGLRCTCTRSMPQQELET